MGIQKYEYFIDPQKKIDLYMYVLYSILFYLRSWNKSWEQVSYIFENSRFKNILEKSLKTNILVKIMDVISVFGETTLRKQKLEQLAWQYLFFLLLTSWLSFTF